MWPPSRLRSIKWKLPLAITALLLAVVSALSWSAYGWVRDADVDRADARLGEVGQQLASLLERSLSTRLDEVREIAADPAVAAAARNPTDAASLDAALPAFEAFLEAAPLVSSVALWAPDGTRVLESHAVFERDSPQRFPGWMVGEEAAVDGFRVADGEIWWEIGAVVPGEEEPLGYVVQSRRLSASPDSPRIIADLIGMAVAFYVGEPGGVWTDLVTEVDGPPPELLAAEGALEYRPFEGRRRYGAITPVRGSNWSVWVEFPRAAVFERSGQFLARWLPIGFATVLLGALGAWAVSHRVTGRLERVTSAARSMAAGGYAERVDDPGTDELGDLARAFSRLAAEVESAQRELEDRVERRTRELRRSEERFGSLARTATDAILTTDARGRITYANPEAEAVFGYASDELLGQPLLVLSPERFHEHHRSEHRRFLTTGSSSFVGRAVEMVGRRRDGSEFRMEVGMAAWGEGEDLAFSCIVRDITLRKETEEALRRYATELEAANRELEAFSYSVSHDLRTPLRSIEGLSQALLEDYEESLAPTGVDYVHRVQAAAHRMSELIDDLLKLARLTSRELQREEVDLSATARFLGDDLRKEEPGRSVELSIQEGVRAHGDASMLRVVLGNLLENAWKFTKREPEARVEFGMSGVNGSQAYFVRDNGAGFDMRYAEDLFGAFKRLHSSEDFPGVGIGLATARRIVERHGGRIWAEASVNGGATFYFTL